MLCPDATASCNGNVTIHRRISQTKDQDNHLQSPLAKRQSNFFLLINVHMIKRIDQFIRGSCYFGFLLWYLLGSPNILLSSWFCPCLSSFPKSWLSFPSPLFLDMKTLKVQTALFRILCILSIFNSVMNQHKLHWISHPNHIIYLVSPCCQPTRILLCLLLLHFYFTVCLWALLLFLLLLFPNPCNKTSYSYLDDMISVNEDHGSLTCHVRKLGGDASPPSHLCQIVAGTGFVVGPGWYKITICHLVFWR